MGLTMFTQLVFVAAFKGEDSVCYSSIDRLFMKSTPFFNWFFCCVIYLDSVRDRIFGSIWDYLRSRDNLRVFSTALKSDYQPWIFKWNVLQCKTFPFIQNVDRICNPQTAFSGRHALTTISLYVILYPVYITRRSNQMKQGGNWQTCVNYKCRCRNF